MIVIVMMFRYILEKYGQLLSNSEYSILLHHINYPLFGCFRPYRPPQKQPTGKLFGLCICTYVCINTLVALTASTILAYILMWSELCFIMCKPSVCILIGGYGQSSDNLHNKINLGEIGQVNGVPIFQYDMNSSDKPWKQPGVLFCNI